MFDPVAGSISMPDFARNTHVVPRPASMALDAARRHAFTGEIVFHLDPAVSVFLDGGFPYFAEVTGSPKVSEQLLQSEVIDSSQLERGVVRVGDLEHLGRLFDRDPSIDQDAVTLVVETHTEQLLQVLAHDVVASIGVNAYRHHPSGIHRWFVHPTDALSGARPPGDFAEPDRSPANEIPGLTRADVPLVIEWSEPDPTGLGVPSDSFVTPPTDADVQSELDRFDADSADWAGVPSGFVDPSPQPVASPLGEFHIVWPDGTEDPDLVQAAETAAPAPLDQLPPLAPPGPADPPAPVDPPGPADPPAPVDSPAPADPPAPVDSPAPPAPAASVDSPAPAAPVDPPADLELFGEPAVAPATDVVETVTADAPDAHDLPPTQPMPPTPEPPREGGEPLFADSVPTPAPTTAERENAATHVAAPPTDSSAPTDPPTGLIAPLRLDEIPTPDEAVPDDVAAAVKRALQAIDDASATSVAPPSTPSAFSLPKLGTSAPSTPLIAPVAAPVAAPVDAPIAPSVETPHEASASSVAPPPAAAPPAPSAPPVAPVPPVAPMLEVPSIDVPAPVDPAVDATVDVTAEQLSARSPLTQPIPSPAAPPMPVAPVATAAPAPPAAAPAPAAPPEPPAPEPAPEPPAPAPEPAPEPPAPATAPAPPASTVTAVRDAADDVEAPSVVSVFDDEAADEPVAVDPLSELGSTDDALAGQASVVFAVDDDGRTLPSTERRGALRRLISSLRNDD